MADSPSTSSRSSSSGQQRREPCPIPLSAGRGKTRFLTNQPTLVESILKPKLDEILVAVLVKVDDAIEGIFYQPIVIKVKTDILPSHLLEGHIGSNNILLLERSGQEPVPSYFAAKGECGLTMSASFRSFTSIISEERPQMFSILKQSMLVLNCDDVKLLPSGQLRLKCISSSTFANLFKQSESIDTHRQRGADDFDCLGVEEMELKKEPGTCEKSKRTLSELQATQDEDEIIMLYRKPKRFCLNDTLDPSQTRQISETSHSTAIHATTSLQRKQPEASSSNSRRVTKGRKSKLIKVSKKQIVKKKGNKKAKDENEELPFDESVILDRPLIAACSPMFNQIKDMRLSLSMLDVSVRDMPETNTRDRWIHFLSFATSMLKFAVILHYKLAEKYHVPRENKTTVEGKHTIIEGEVPVLTGQYIAAKTMPGKKDPMTLLGNIIRHTFPTACIEKTTLSGTESTYSIAQTLGFANPLEEPFKGLCDEQRGEARLRALMDHACRLCGYMVYDKSVDSNLRTKIAKTLYAEKCKIKGRQEAGEEEEENGSVSENDTVSDSQTELEGDNLQGNQQQLFSENLPYEETMITGNRQKSLRSSNISSQVLTQSVHVIRLDRGLIEPDFDSTEPDSAVFDDEEETIESPKENLRGELRKEHESGMSSSSQFSHPTVFNTDKNKSHETLENLPLSKQTSDISTTPRLSSPLMGLSSQNQTKNNLRISSDEQNNNSSEDFALSQRDSNGQEL